MPAALTECLLNWSDNSTRNASATLVILKSIQQLADGQVKRICDTVENRDGGIADAMFDAGDVGAVKIGLMAEFFLAEP